jgi:hypothetical protein
MENSTPPEPLLHQIFSAQLEISRQNERAITQGEIRGLADIETARCSTSARARWVPRAAMAKLWRL